MKKNMGSLDKALRVLIALTIAGLYASNIITGNFAILAGILAAIFSFTSAVSFCPLYAPFNIKTRKEEKQKA